MFSTTDTIVAIATPPGRGAIGVVRLSGPDATTIVERLAVDRSAFAPRHATLATIAAEGITDRAIVTWFAAPQSYTGEDVVEISAHGSPIVLRSVVAACVAGGARAAAPGEFTLRAFLNGRIDLPQAEAVADLVDAVTPLQARAAFDQLSGTLTAEIAALDAMLFDLIARLEASVDFPDEGYHFVDREAVGSELGRIISRTRELLAAGRRGRLIREGFQIAIVGAPNVGKSTLFNALVGAPRAIVADVPGTTRDLVTETGDLLGYRATFVDTAGLRDTADVVEIEGVSRSRQAAAAADLVLLVTDDDNSTQLIDGEKLVVRSKCDLRRSEPGGETLDGRIRVSALTGEGLETLRHAIVDRLDRAQERERAEITNVRHVHLVERAHAALLRAREAVELSEEFVLADLQEARAALEEIVGRRAPDDLLAHIFARFCIGK